MHEVPDDIKRLQNVIEASMQRAGPFLRSSLEIPEKSLNAKQLIRRLSGSLTVSLATVSSKGMPRVAPVLAFFYRGAFHVPTVSNALRSMHVRANPHVSLTLYEGNDFAVIVHGDGVLIDETDTDFDSLVSLQERLTGDDVREWGDAVYIRVDPSHFYSFARYPDHFPSNRSGSNRTSL